jgi:hypothetical protein
MKRFMGFVVASLAVMGAGYAWADWQQTAAGTYNYDDPANWTDGTPNGVFPSTLTLTGDQTVVFTNDTAIAALDFSYAGDYKMTLRSDGTGPKTLSLSGDIQAVVNKSVQAAHVTIGSADALSNLVLDLGGASRTITASASQNDPSKIGRFVSYAKLTNGAVRYEGAGVIKLYGTSDYADGTVLANTGYIYLNADAALGSGTNETVSTASVWPRLHTDVADCRRGGHDRERRFEALERRLPSREERGGDSVQPGAWRQLRSPDPQEQRFRDLDVHVGRNGPRGPIIPVEKHA